MNRSWRRPLAKQLCALLHAVSPAKLRGWAEGLRLELADIQSDGEALLFALGGFCGLFPRALLAHLLTPFVALSGSTDPSGDASDMSFHPDIRRHQRALGLICATGAVMLGIAYMAAAEAPFRYLALNAGALGIGLAAFTIFGLLKPSAGRSPGLGIFALAILLLMTALLGDRIEGVARWLKVGPLFIQPSLLLLPAMILAFAQKRSFLSTAAMIVASAALALQPDRAMAGMLTASLAALTILRPDRLVGGALVGSTLAFVVTLVRADTLPAMPYVDQVLYSAFEVHTLAGAAVMGGTMLLLVPAINGWRHGGAARELYATFGMAWLAAILAAAIGNYPTPIVGYGGSAIIGYLLSLAVLPKSMSACATGVVGPVNRDTRPPDPHRQMALPRLA